MDSFDDARINARSGDEGLRMTISDKTHDDIDIIDAHFHLWDLDDYRYPWLQDDPMIPFRYGDYGTIRRNYLIADYRRDSSAHNVIAAVHMEAEWKRDDPVAETRWVQGIAERHGFPNAIVAQAWFADENIAAVLSAHAAFSLVRGVRQKPPAASTPDQVIRGAPRSMDDPAWGGTATPCSPATACLMTFRPRIGISRKRPSWPAIFRARQSSSITLVYQQTGPRTGYPVGVGPSMNLRTRRIRA